MEYQVSSDGAAKLAAAHADRAAEKMRAAMAPQRADALGLLGVGMPGTSARAEASSSAPMLNQIYERIATRNDQLREIIERLESAMDRMQPLDVDRSPVDKAPEAPGIIGRIEASVDSQGELLSRLGRIVSRLETIA